MNEAVAVKSEALVLDTAETEKGLGKEASLIEQKAKSVVVANDADYVFASELTKDVKRMQKKVKEYWEPLRMGAKKTYDDILAKKKEMLDPIESAERILKSKLGDYVVEKERKRREQEEALRRLAQKEVDKKIEEAIQANDAGDAVGAEFALTDAEVMEGIALGGVIRSQTPISEGVSTAKAWKIVSVDESQVPVAVNGAVIRPVDEKAVMALIKASKGKIEIPGIKYEETVTISVRSK